MAAGEYEDANDNAFPPRCPKLEQSRKINERSKANLGREVVKHGPPQTDIPVLTIALFTKIEKADPEMSAHNIALLFGSDKLSL